MKIKIASLIRIIVTLLLIYGAYTEAGIFTALSFFFLFLNTELRAWAEKNL